jgi:hypothetical protein
MLPPSPPHGGVFFEINSLLTPTGGIGRPGQTDARVFEARGRLPAASATSHGSHLLCSAQDGSGIKTGTDDAVSYEAYQRAELVVERRVVDYLRIAKKRSFVNYLIHLVGY